MALINKTSAYLLGILTGWVTAAIVLVVIGMVTTWNSFNKFKEQFDSDTSVSYRMDNAEEDQETERQYFTVHGCKGEVQLYIGMPQDSVKALVGKPTNVMAFANHQIWKYDNIPGRSYGLLTIDFDADGLTSASEI